MTMLDQIVEESAALCDDPAHGALRHALEQVYSGDQSVEADAVADALEGIGFAVLEHLSRGEGEIRAFDEYRSNADLIAAVARLGYLREDDYVLDPTWGRGTFWRAWQPTVVQGADLNPAKSPTGQSVDVTNLPWNARHFDVVVFDPPYKLCLDHETEVLTRQGWRTWATLKVGAEVYSLDHRTGLGCWREVLDVNVYEDEETEVVVCEGKNLDFVSTPDHRWPVVDRAGKRVWRTSASLVTGDRVIHAAPWVAAPTVATIPDAMVELVAWFWTEGTVDTLSAYGHITQSHVVNPTYCARIEACLATLYGPRVERFERRGRNCADLAWRIRDEERNRRFIFSAAVGAEMLAHAPRRVPSQAFIEALTPAQLELFIDTSLAADGSSADRLAQKNHRGADAFAMACLLSGRGVTMLDRNDGNGLTVNIKRRPHSKPHRVGTRSEVRYALMWCPTIAETSTWLARRNGRVYFTGNSGTPALGEFDNRYGVHEATTRAERERVILDGTAECCRVARRGVLVKIQNQVNGGKVRWQTDQVTAVAAAHGFEKVDELVMLGGRPQPAGRRQVHARRNGSSLLVFERTNQAAQPGLLDPT